MKVRVRPDAESADDRRKMANAAVGSSCLFVSVCVWLVAVCAYVLA